MLHGHKPDLDLREQDISRMDYFVLPVASLKFVSSKERKVEFTVAEVGWLTYSIISV